MERASRRGPDGHVRPRTRRLVEDVADGGRGGVLVCAAPRHPAKSGLHMLWTGRMERTRTAFRARPTALQIALFILKRTA